MSTALLSNAVDGRAADGQWAVETHGLNKRFGENVAVRQVTQFYRRCFVELMQLKEDEADFDLAFALVVDAEPYRLDSAVRWLDMVDVRQQRAASASPASSPAPRLARRLAVRR